MYIELEKNNKNPDIRCPVCKAGIDIYTESNEEKNYTIQCINCNVTLQVSQEIFKNYKLKKYEKY
jgi:hypothetical protein